MLWADAVFMEMVDKPMAIIRDNSVLFFMGDFSFLYFDNN
jgi:hypothetical protein